MFIWDDGESVTVTGSVDHAVLDAYKKAKDAGEDLSPFAQYMGVPPEAQAEWKPQPVQQPATATGPAGAVTEINTVPVEVEVPDVEVASVSSAVNSSASYDAWSLAELQDEAVARGLAKSGNKADLAERLREDDASPDQEE